MKTEVEYDSSVGVTYFEVEPKKGESKVFAMVSGPGVDGDELSNQLKDFKMFLNDNDLDIDFDKNELVIKNK